MRRALLMIMAAAMLLSGALPAAALAAPNSILDPATGPTFPEPGSDPTFPAPPDPSPFPIPPGSGPTLPDPSPGPTFPQPEPGPRGGGGPIDNSDEGGIVIDCAPGYYPVYGPDTSSLEDDKCIPWDDENAPAANQLNGRTDRGIIIDCVPGYYPVYGSDPSSAEDDRCVPKDGRPVTEDDNGQNLGKDDEDSPEAAQGESSSARTPRTGPLAAATNPGFWGWVTRAAGLATAGRAVVDIWDWLQEREERIEAERRAIQACMIRAGIPEVSAYFLSDGFFAPGTKYEAIYDKCSDAVRNNPKTMK